MNSFFSILEKPLKYYSQWDFLVFTLLTALSIWSGQTTVFYVILFFWWNEFIRIIIDRIFFKRNKNAVLASNKTTSIFGSIIQMIGYFIFIVVFFGFMANWNNEVLIFTNMKVLFFRNWFFNLNLIFVTIERVLLHIKQTPVTVSFGAFTPNMLVLHVSIILGVVLMLFIVRNFPETFTPTNLFGSVLIIFPFLMIRAFALYLRIRYK